MDLFIEYVLLVSLQIRQEKPYYIADPEVDSLVSCYSNYICLFLSAIFNVTLRV